MVAKSGYQVVHPVHMDICPNIFQLKKKLVSLVFSFLNSNGSRKTKLVLKNTGTVNFELVCTNAVCKNTKAKFKK